MDHARLSCKQGFKRLHELGMGHAWFEKVNMGGEIAPLDFEKVELGLVQRSDKAMPDVADRAREKVGDASKSGLEGGPSVRLDAQKS